MDQKPYWHVERARIGDTRRVPVELIVNGVAVARKQIEADGSLREIAFEHKLDRSSWVALRILPSSHTNPVWAIVGGQPVRSRESAEWCLRAVDTCERQKTGRVRLEEIGAMKQAYEHARREYSKRLAEAR